jgi:hypothetical protein
MTKSSMRPASSGRFSKSTIGFAIPTIIAVTIGWTGCSAGGGSPAPTGGSSGSSGQQGNGGAFQGTGGSNSDSTGGFTQSSSSGGDQGGGQVIALDGGGFQNPPVDKSILFNWSVDNANPALSCQPGHYKGAFTGFYAPALVVFPAPIPVVGDVEMYLAQGQNGEFLTITNGIVSGNADFLADYRCDITGTLDCTLKKIVNGALSNCSYCVGRFAGDGGSALCLGVEGHFKGPLGADYDAANQSLENGTWKGKEGSDAGLYGGSGKWSANYTGP